MTRHVCVRFTLSRAAAARHPADLEAVFGATSAPGGAGTRLEFTYSCDLWGYRRSAEPFAHVAGKLDRLARVAAAEGAPVALVEHGWGEAGRDVGTVLAALGRLRGLGHAPAAAVAAPARG